MTQRPVTAAALAGPATVNPPAFVPKWELVALDDHAIPAQAELFLDPRAQARRVHGGALWATRAQPA